MILQNKIDYNALREKNYNMTRNGRHRLNEIKKWIIDTKGVPYYTEMEQQHYKFLLSDESQYGLSPLETEFLNQLMLNIYGTDEKYLKRSNLSTTCEVMQAVMYYLYK